MTSETPRLSKNAQVVLERRYLAKDKEGVVVETADEMFRRVARNLAQADALHDKAADLAAVEEEFYYAMSRLEFLPNSPTLMNAGRELQQLSACFVLPVEDSLTSIFDAVKFTALIHKSGGGTGFAFSRLRPEKDVVGSTGGVASGPVSFIRAFDTATDVVKQGGTRRGANMGILHVSHPDILKFIHSKEDGKSLSNFNISVAVTEEFMEKAERGEEYELINPRTKQVVGRLNARKVFDEMVELAWKTGDPGIVFLDRINRAHPTPHLGAIESTNPCGEQPLMPYESCNLGSINLARMVHYAKDGAEVDWERLADTIGAAVHFLDNVIDMNRYPLPEIERVTKLTRKIGLGVMGFADLLIQLGVAYDSDEGLELGERVMRFISEKSDEASIELAKVRGVFPAWKGSTYDRPGGPRFRNSTRTTVAPTGTISIIAGASSGIEPLFALSYVRNVMDNDRLVEVNPSFDAVAHKEGFHSRELMALLAEKGSLHRMDGAIPEWVKRVFVTSHDITPEWHVRMQAAFQRHTDNAVSKTINFSHAATVKDVEDAYMLAFKLGCKGTTIYRDGSKENQVLSTGETEKHRAVEGAVLQPRSRPSVVHGVTERIRTGHGNMYVTINFDEQNHPFEVFTALGKAGGCDSAQLEAISRLVSLALRSGVDPKTVVEQLRGLTCCPAWDNGILVRSAPDAVSLAMSRHLAGEAAPRAEAAQLKLFSESARPGAGHQPQNGTAPHTRCPDCNSPLAYQEGCLLCTSCGWNKCG
ncbi:MAG: vitamin B12-dependent ribonucleotide reductase [Chloroflexota bacterium]|nr:vitamin B12-dependent ribonucleotide reductase [Chloroflexota bacterium]